ncbi:MAG: hypothetical protein ABFD81_14510 [Syntrophaceae bacterium]
MSKHRTKNQNWARSTRGSVNRGMKGFIRAIKNIEGKLVPAPLVSKGKPYRNKAEMKARKRQRAEAVKARGGRGVTHAIHRKDAAWVDEAAPVSEKSFKALP